MVTPLEEPRQERRGGRREGAGAKTLYSDGPMVRVTIRVDGSTTKLLSAFKAVGERGAFIRDAMNDLLAELELPKRAREPIKIPEMSGRRVNLKIHLPALMRTDAERFHIRRRPFRTLSEMIRTAVARAAGAA